MLHETNPMPLILFGLLSYYSSQLAYFGIIMIVIFGYVNSVELTWPVISKQVFAIALLAPLWGHSLFQKGACILHLGEVTVDYVVRVTLDLRSEIRLSLPHQFKWTFRAWRHSFGNAVEYVTFLLTPKVHSIQDWHRTPTFSNAIIAKASKSWNISYTWQSNWFGSF